MVRKLRRSATVPNAYRLLARIAIWSIAIVTGCMAILCAFDYASANRTSAHSALNSEHVQWKEATAVRPSQSTAILAGFATALKLVSPTLPSGDATRTSLLRHFEKPYRPQQVLRSHLLPPETTMTLFDLPASVAATRPFHLAKDLTVPLANHKERATADVLPPGKLSAGVEQHESALATLFNERKGPAGTTEVNGEAHESLRYLYDLFTLGVLLVAVVASIVAWTSTRALKRAEVLAGQMTVERAEALQNLDYYKRAMDSSAIVAFTDKSGRITHANEKFCEISEYSLPELKGKTHRIVNSGLHSREFWREMWRTISGGAVWHAEVCNRTKSGRIYWVESYCQILWMRAA